jgi:hypothetical protein
MWGHTALYLPLTMIPFRGVYSIIVGVTRVLKHIRLLYNSLRQVMVPTTI